MKSSFPKCYKSILIVFIQGRYRWRHDLVLRKLAEVTESCRQEANSRPSAPTRRPILFARAGENINHRHQRTTPRVLSSGSEGNMRVDLGRQLQFPREIVETSLRPDLIMWSEPCKTILLVELTVHGRKAWRLLTSGSVPSRAQNCDHFGHICSRNVICATPKYIWEHLCECK